MKPEIRSKKPDGRRRTRIWFLASGFWFLASSLFAGGQITAKHAALTTDHPLATKAGLAVLQRGGNAADAAVAVASAGRQPRRWGLSAVLRSFDARGVGARFPGDRAA